MESVELLPDSQLIFIRDFIPDPTNYNFTELLKQTKWQQDKVFLFGRYHLAPRLTAYYGEENASYTYAGMKQSPLKFTPLLEEFKNRIQDTFGERLNAVLLNYYRNGNDKMGWHADDENELGKNPFIASLSFGAERFIDFKHHSEKENRIRVALTNGSLLVMQGELQHHWKHQIPIQKKVTEGRINLTFRLIKK